MNGTDPTAPDIEQARRRFPAWTFWRDGRAWRARRAGGPGPGAELEGLSLESLEGKVARAERARPDAGEGGPQGDTSSPASLFAAYP